MSVEAIAIALHHSKAAGTTKLVLVGIANHDGDGGAYPGVATLAKYAGKSERTVQRALEELIDLGEVLVHYNAGGDRDTAPDRRPNLYEIVLTCPADCDRSKHHRTPGDPGYGVTRVSPRRGKRGDVDVTPRGDVGVTPRGDTGDANGVTQVSPEPSLEPTTPQPPAQRGASCTRHPDAPGDNCRGCRTTQRQRDAAAAADAIALQREQDRRAAAEGIARRAEAARAQQAPTTRTAIAEARQKIQAAAPTATTTGSR